MARWRLDLEYDGTDFAGWQLQPGLRTIQGTLEDAVERVFGAPIRIGAAGRTDSGVHAEHQVVAFESDAPRTERGALLGLNGVLPPDVAVFGARIVPDSFDPRRTAHAKRYRYRWLVRKGRSPLRRHRTWHLKLPLDVAAMGAAAASLAGTRDFESFRASGCSAATSLRTIPVVEVVEAGDEVHLRMEGTGFLRNMIRIVAGSLTEVGHGRWPVERVAEVLAARDRTRAGPTAPPQGLTLERIWYVDEPGAPAFVGLRGAP